MNGSEQCPTELDLQAFQRGELSVEARAVISLHLKECSRCQTAVSQAPAADDQTQVGFRSPSGNVSIPAASGSDTITHAMPPPNDAGGDACATSTSATHEFLQPPQQDGEIGRIGEYRVLAELGSGGMGIVFHAEDIVLSRPVALKVVRPDLRNQEEGWQRLLREARAMAGIKHEHLVGVYQAGREDEVFYLAMELLKGESLDERAKREPPLEATEILRLGREIASGLSAIHDQGLVHRDIKPSNIWLEAPAGRVRILDFGLARQASPSESTNLTQMGTVVGTPAFMSPEQARGDAVDAGSDLFSLGCVLYCLCTGKRPFAGDTLMAQLTALAVDTPAPILELNEKIPPALAELVMRLLAKRRDERPESAKAVIEEIQRIEGGATDARKPLARATGNPGPRWLRIAVVFVLAGVGAFLAGMIWRAQGPNAAPRPFARPPENPRPQAAQAAQLVSPLQAHLQPVVGGGERVFAIALPEVDMDSVYFPVATGKPGKRDPHMPDNVFRRFGVQGQPSPNGIGMHPMRRGPAFLSLTLGKQYRKFQAVVSQNEGVRDPPVSPMIFSVYGDGKLLWESKPIDSSTETDSCARDVSGVDLLTLEVKSTGDARGAHAIWFEPYLEK